MSSLQYASDDVNRATFLIDTWANLRKLETYINCTLAIGVLSHQVPALKVRLLSNRVILNTLQVSFGIIVTDPWYLQPPHNLLAVEIFKKIADLRVSVTELLAQLTHQEMVASSIK